MKRIVSMILVAVMMLSFVPLQAAAATYQYVSGSFGNAMLTRISTAPVEEWAELRVYYIADGNVITAATELAGPRGGLLS